MLLIALSAAAQAQSTPNILGGTIQGPVGNPACDGGWTGTVKGTVGKGTATFGCSQNTAYMPLQYIDPPRPGSLSCYAVLTTLTLTTDKYPDGIDLNLEARFAMGHWCTQRRYTGTCASRLGTWVDSMAIFRRVTIGERTRGLTRRMGA
jgi:hypothetical protein